MAPSAIFSPHDLDEIDGDADLEQIDEREPERWVKARLEIITRWAHY